MEIRKGRKGWMVALAATVLLGGCAGMGEKPDLGRPEYRLDPATGKGLVVASVTMPWFRSGHPKNAAVNLQYGPPGAMVMRSFVLEHEDTITGRNIQGDFGDQTFGVVFAAELPAGDYLLYGWNVWGNTTSFSFEPKNLAPIPFKVTAGRATYVGNLDLAVNTGQNLIGAEVLRSLRGTLSDAYDRDLTLFLKKWPGVQADQVDNKVTVGEGWATKPAN